jgi:hypothetical protein
MARMSQRMFALTLLSLATVIVLAVIVESAFFRY